MREQIASEWVTDLDVLQQANEQILDSYFATAVEERTGGVEGVPVAAFERTAVNLLNNHTGFSVGASSPFRKGNFDLLYNICTQTAIHRLLSDLSKDSRNEVPYQFLRDFYSEMAAEYFDGDQQYGRADDFLEQLLLTSPSVIQSKSGGKPALADPMWIAEQIIRNRTSICAEWKALMQRVPEDHQGGIRKVLLEKQMEAWGSSPTAGGDSSFQ